jgi:hypothetical protein
LVRDPAQYLAIVFPLVTQALGVSEQHLALQVQGIKWKGIVV